MRRRLGRLMQALTGVVVLLVGMIGALAMPAGAAAPRERPRHEGSDLSTRGVLMTAGFLLLGLALAVLAASWVETRVSGHGVRLTPPTAGVGDQPSTLPRQQPSGQGALPLSGAPADALADLRAEEAHTLTTYGWIDPGAGVVRIPIDRAMDLLVARGMAPSSPAGGGAQR